MSPATAPGVRLPAYSILNAAGLRLRTGVASCILSMGCGALAVLAFAPFNLYPLAVFSLLVLFWLLGSASKRRAFLLGFLFGATEFGFGVYWLYISIHDIANAPLWLTLPIIGALVAVMALYSACACSLGVWLTPVAGWRRWILVLPAVWTLLEWLRGWLLTGFPWLSLGYSQIDSWLRGYAPLAGVYGVSLTVALSAGLLLSVLNKQSIARTR
ncbi:MAG: apolipoprotein N-acyltransferase, partial [Gammaproteobacteria bacterium]|nr:apolipoprotein N-acyltransferase [Gammaproteobacteria bacterium]